MNQEQIEREREEIARLWHLAWDVTHRVFGSEDIFHDRTDDQDLALQAAGKEFVPVVMKLQGTETQR